MKTYLTILISAFLFVSCQSGNKANKDENIDLTPLTISMDIQGMTCNGCAETVRASVAQMGEGINSVKVDLENASALIEFVPGKLDSVDIRKAIEINGYKILGVKEKVEE